MLARPFHDGLELLGVLVSLAIANVGLELVTNRQGQLWKADLVGIVFKAVEKTLEDLINDIILASAIGDLLLGQRDVSAEILLFWGDGLVFGII